MEQNIYIVGAHSRAQTLGVYLKKLNPHIKIAAYLYDNEEVNRKEIDGVPVLYFDEATRLRTDYPVLISGLVISASVVVIAFLVFQKQFIRGLSQGSIKG